MNVISSLLFLSMRKARQDCSRPNGDGSTAMRSLHHILCYGEGLQDLQGRERLLFLLKCPMHTILNPVGIHISGFLIIFAKKQ